MRKKILALILIFLIVIIQVSFLANLFPRHIAPNIILVLIVIWSAKEGFGKSWPWAMTAGFTLDILSLGIIGFNIISFFLISLQTDYFAKKFLVAYKTADFFVIMILVALGTVVNEFITISLFQITKFFSMPKTMMSFKMFQTTNFFLQLLYNIIIFIAIYWLVLKFENVFQRHSKKPVIQ